MTGKKKKFIMVHVRGFRRYDHYTQRYYVLTSAGLRKANSGKCGHSGQGLAIIDKEKVTVRGSFVAI